MTEKELPSNVETLKKFQNILLGHKIEVFMDHKNIPYKKDRERLSECTVLEEHNAGVWGDSYLYKKS